MDFSFIIINYRSLDYTRACLESLFAFLPTDGSWEIILIDNDSQDGSAETLVREFSGRIRFIQNDQNRGFAAANNQGAALAQGRFLFFLNSDTEIKNNILIPTRELLDHQPAIGLLAPLVLNPEGKWQFGACGRRQTLGNLLKQNTKTNWLRDKPVDYWETDWVSGAALIIRHELFDRLNGWDEKFFLYLEDSDLCFRAQKAGAQVAICPAAELIHYGGQSPASDRIRRQHYYRSQAYYFKKHYGLFVSLLMRLARWPYKSLVLSKQRT